LTTVAIAAIVPAALASFFQSDLDIDVSSLLAYRRTRDSAVDKKGGPHEVDVDPESVSDRSSTTFAIEIRKRCCDILQGLVRTAHALECLSDRCPMDGSLGCCQDKFHCRRTLFLGPHLVQLDQQEH
jgi:hypothetical protein